MEEEKEMLEQTNETENVETQTTEENEEGIELTDTSNAESNEIEEEAEEKEEVKTFTQDEVDEIVKKRLARKEREFENKLSKYRDAENVLNAGLGVNDITEATPKLREFYKEQGIDIPEATSGYSDHRIQLLAKAEAEEIIKEGYDSMLEEAERLARKEYKNLNPEEKIVFDTLAEKLTEEKNRKELLKLGAKEELLSDKSFIDFKKQFNSNVPMETIYSLYSKTNTQKTVKENPGSMKNNEVSKYKDFYTKEEIDKLTEEDLDDPKVWEAVRRSQTSTAYKNYYE